MEAGDSAAQLKSLGASQRQLAGTVACFPLNLGDLAQVTEPACASVSSSVKQDEGAVVSQHPPARLLKLVAGPVEGTRAGVLQSPSVPVCIGPQPLTPPVLAAPLMAPTGMRVAPQLAPSHLARALLVTGGCTQRVLAALQAAATVSTRHTDPTNKATPSWRSSRCPLHQPQVTGLPQVTGKVAHRSHSS